jgi:hypothetical protein
MVEETLVDPQTRSNRHLIANIVSGDICTIANGQWVSKFDVDASYNVVPVILVFSPTHSCGLNLIGAMLVLGETWLTPMV